MRQPILFLSSIFISFLGFTQPINLSTTNINSTDAILNWDNGGCSQTYTLRIQLAGASSWQQGINIPNSSTVGTYILTGLLSSTTYNWKVNVEEDGVTLLALRLHRAPLFLNQSPILIQTHCLAMEIKIKVMLI
jgi:hypothetical protein